MLCECTYLTRVIVLEGEIERFLDFVPECATGSKFRSDASYFLECLYKLEDNIKYIDDIPF